MISEAVTIQSSISVSITQTTGDQPDLRARVRSLVDAIKAGDLQGAKDAFAKITDTQTQKSDGDNDSEASESPFEKLLEKLGDALSSNNIGAAQKALADFEASKPNGPPPQGALPELGPLTDAAKNAFVELVKSLRSENLTDAKHAYGKLLAERSDNANTAKSRLDKFLEQIGAALHNSDLASAQDVLRNLTAEQPYGSAFDLTA